MPAIDSSSVIVTSGLVALKPVRHSRLMFVWDLSIDIWWTGGWTQTGRGAELDRPVWVHSKPSIESNGCRL